MKYMTFLSARTFVRKLNLKSFKEWQEYSRSDQLPKNIPKTPSIVYKNKGWRNTADWLGIGIVKKVSKQFLSYYEARLYVSNLKIKNFKEWRAYAKSSKKPENIPSRPEQVYKENGWINFYDWLGTNKTHKTKFRSFKSARKFIRSLEIYSERNWRTFCKSGNKPSDIPSHPETSYKDLGWISYSDWLGTDHLRPSERLFLPYTEAKSFVHTLWLKNSLDWRAYCVSGDKPPEIPSSPDHVYKNKGWVSMQDWLGTHKN